MLAPQSAKCLIRQVGQWYETILMALAVPDMYLFALAVDIPHLQRQGLSEAQAHRIGCQQKDPVAQLACRTDQLFNLRDGENIRQRMYFRDFDHLYPLPVAFKHMLPEKLQTITINLDGTPGMGLNQLGKVFFSLFQGQLIGAAIKMLTDPPHSPRIGINGLLAFTLKFEQTQVMLIKFIKSIRFSLVHGILPFNGARNWATMGGYTLV